MISARQAARRMLNGAFKTVSKKDANILKREYVDGREQVCDDGKFRNVCFRHASVRKCQSIYT